jgi:3-oxoacyl-[acyl-carrier-protein] synthase-1
VEDHQQTPLTGHPAWTLTEGMAAPARWRVLSEAALRDLTGTSAFPDATEQAFWEQTALIAVTPVLDDARFFYMPSCHSDRVWDACLGPSLEASGIHVQRNYTRVVSVGQAGLFRALEMADHWFQQNQADRVIVLAVDSLLDPMSLLWLTDYDRLKCDSMPVGLSPGEAGCALLLETPRSAEARGASVLASVEGTAVELDGAHFLSAEARNGESQGAVLRRGLKSSRKQGSFCGDAILDLNGEEWRAVALGTALAGFSADELGNVHLTMPAESIGDVGAASCAIGMVVATRSFARGYASSEETLILGTSDYGETGTALLRGA